ncbi:hypothetical protein DBT42_00750 [Aerococcus urinae]|nr:hypothetical protein DBT42_00750 [Aerococcus urinae]
MVDMITSFLIFSNIVIFILLDKLINCNRLLYYKNVFTKKLPDNNQEVPPRMREIIYALHLIKMTIGSPPQVREN